MKVTSLLAFMFLLFGSAYAQQTVFNVPSADVLDRGKVYSEIDVMDQPVLSDGTFTPRLVYGVGHNVEVGLNISSFAFPAASTVALVPVIKWKFAELKSIGVSFYGGEHLFLPVYRRSYAAGSYSYISAAKTIHNMRLTLGAYDFTAHVVDRGNRAGVQAALEQTVNSRFTAAVDWYSGNHAAGYVTPGLVFKLSKQVTGYAAYEIANAGLHNGNHGFLLELGWTLN